MSDDYQKNLSFFVFISPKGSKVHDRSTVVSRSPNVRNKSISQSRNFLNSPIFHRNLETKYKTVPRNMQLSNIDTEAIKEIFCKKQIENLLTPRRKKIHSDKINRDKVKFN
jgi:hypothetical protein